jgi:transcriptional regulator with XRE-family HTH domain
MAWKELTTKELADTLGVDFSEVEEKQRLIDLIVKARKSAKISQAALAKNAGVTQSRIAQIESGVGTSKITFDVLFNILRLLGYSLKITPKKAA